MKKTPAIAIAALLAVAGTGAAQAQGLSYNYAQLAYERVDLDDIDVDFDGFSISGSWLLNEDLYIFGGYGEGETSTYNIGVFSGKVGLEAITAGLGWRYGLSDQTDLNLSAAFERSKVRGKGDFDVIGSESDNGYSLSVGLRHLLIPRLEVGADVTYIDVIDDDTVFTAGVLGHLTPNFSIGGSYSVGSDAKSWSVGVRFNF
jgi:long-subunit fatty acid transport protein